MASTVPAQSDASLAALIPLGSIAKADPIEIKRPITLIGSRKEIVRLHLQSSTVSSAHAVVVLNAWGCYVHDLGSRSGTQVNGRPVTDADLADGDVLKIGRFEFKYRAPRRTKPKPAAPEPVDVEMSNTPVPFPVAKRVLVIGRRAGADLPLASRDVSNIHALIVEQDGRRLIRDVDSRTGTWIFDTRVRQETLPDGLPIRVADATITVRPRANSAAPTAEPITLADAAPAAAVGLDAPPEAPPKARPAKPTDALALAALDLDALDIDALDPAAPESSVADADTLDLGLDAAVADSEIDPSDDLALLRRGWKTPPLADDLLEPPAVEPPAAEAPKPVTPAEEVPADELPIDDVAVDEISVDEAVAIDESVAERPPIAPTPPVLAALPELEPLEPAEAEALELETPEPEPADADAEPRADAGAAAVVDPKPDGSLSIEDLLNTPASPIEVAGPTTAEAADDVVDDVMTEPADHENVAALAPDLVDDLGTAMPAGVSDVPGDELELDEPSRLDLEIHDDASSDAVADSAADVTADVVVPPATVETPAVVAVAGLDLEPLDLSDIELTLDPDAPALSDEEAADVDALLADPDAPAVGSEVADTATPPFGLESAPVVSDTADTAPPAAAALPPEVAADAAADVVLDADLDDELDLEPLDLSDLVLEADPAAPASAAVDADIDALVLDPAAPAAETPEIVGRHGVSDTSGPASDTAARDADVAEGVDQIDLDADEAEEHEVAAAWADPMNEAVIDEAVADTLPPGVAAAETVVAPPDARTPANTVGLDDLSSPAEDPSEEIGIAGRPVIEPDLIRLAEDNDDEANEATALAVDLGLILDEDGPDTTPDGVPDVVLERAAGPAEPVEIDLTASRRGEPIELPRLGPAHLSPAAFDATLPATPAAAHPPEDVFDADAVEETPTPQPAAEATPPDADEPPIPPPQGGSLADLMPSGPPLLGGSFMSMPQAMPEAFEPPPGQKRRPLRVGFGHEPAKPAAPFAARRTISDAVGAPTHLDDEIGTPNGLVTPVAPTADAFGGRPTVVPPAELPVEDAPALPVERFRPRGTIRPNVPASPGASPGATPVAAPLPADTGQSITPAAVYSAENELLRAKKHRRRVRRVITCLVAMVVLIGGAAWGVYYFTPLKSTVDAYVQFDKLDMLGTEERSAFQDRQNRLIVSETVRTNALTSLPPSVKDPGFLAGGRTLYDTVISDPKIRWPADQPSRMRLRVRSDDKINDVYRLRALAEELVKAAGPDVKRRGELVTQANEDKLHSDALRRQLTDLNDQLQALQQAAVNRPPVRSASDLNAEFLDAEPALTNIKVARQELEATVDRLSKPAQRTGATPPVDVANADEELARLSMQLNELQQSVARPPAAGEEARKKLDASITQLEQNLADAQKLRDNPQLTAYVELATRMFKQMRDFTESLIRRQETMQTQLGELKARWGENQQALTQDRLAKDTELKKLRDARDMLERQVNAAKASGFGEEGQKKELELRLMRVKVAEREDQFSNDSVYSPGIASLQKLIDDQERQIKADRKDIDNRLTALQSDFLRTAPAVEKMPAEQKALAEGIETKMKAMNDARRAYDAATEAAAAEQAKAEAASKDKIAGLRQQIAARRQDVINAAAARQAQDDEAARRKQLADAQTQLADVRLAEQKAAHRYADAVAAIEKNAQQQRVNAQADNDRQTKLSERDRIDRELRTVQSSLATRQAQLARLIVPDRNVEMLTDDDKDHRPLVAGSLAGGIAILLLIPILLDLLALSREAHGDDFDDYAEQTKPAVPPGEGFDVVQAEDDRKALPAPASVG